MTKKKNNKTKVFTIVSFILFVFFLFGIFHNWANNLIINLHFCNHNMCILFSLVFLAFGLIASYRIYEKKKVKNALIIIAGIILIIGIIFMNITYCDSDGGMHVLAFGVETVSVVGVEDAHPPGESYTVPTPPCRETDFGRDYITPGSILSGADVEDLCMSGDILRERYCNSVTTYTSEDVSCSEEYGDFWICEDR